MRRPALINLALAAALLSALPAKAIEVKDFAADISPCTDFFEFVNSRWAAQTELPASRTRIGSFDQLRINNDLLLEKALIELVAQPASQTTPGLKLVAAYFASGMDENAIEARGLKSLQPLLAKIAAVKAVDDLPAMLAALNRVQIAAPLGSFVRSDPKDTTRHVLAIGQSGLGLPDRDDYLKPSELATKLLGAYRTYARRLLTAAGSEPSEAALDALIAFETRLAEATKARAEMRDPNASYNPMSPAELAAAAPGLDWQAYLNQLTMRRDGKHGVARLIVGQPEFAKRVAELAASTAPAVWRDYLTLRLLDANADRLPKAFASAHFDYHRMTINGLKARPPRAEEVILAIGGRTGGSPLAMGLGELFVSRAFSPEAQSRALQLVADVKTAMRKRIENVDWMTAATKLRALEKLEAMAPKIGGPEKWLDYAGLSLAADDYAGNMLRAAAWHTGQQMADLDLPVDRKRWFTSPHIVNAFAGGLNEITFPAGILQPPFFDAKADDAINYGGIGMVIGHEITHHFDDRGRKFDSIGRLNDWWTAADATAYQQRAERVVALYGGYQPVPGMAINGRLTLGENISDMSGLPIAFDGLQIALQRSAAGKAQPLIDGYTPEQRFFLSNALVWRSKIRTEALINQLRTDSHSPAKYRVLAPMSNSPAFAQAFNCKAENAMVAADPIKVW